MATAELHAVIPARASHEVPRVSVAALLRPERDAPPSKFFNNSWPLAAPIPSSSRTCQDRPALRTAFVAPAARVRLARESTAPMVTRARRRTDADMAATSGAIVVARSDARPMLSKHRRTKPFRHSARLVNDSAGDGPIAGSCAQLGMGRP
jgi:hypothetical protein